MPPHSVLLGAAALAAVLSSSVLLDAQNTPSSDPRAELEPAPFLALTGHVDSNSPAIWHLTDGRPELFVMTSVAGRPSTARGPSLRRLSAATPVELEPWPGGGVWMEAVIADVDGTWYGY